MLGGATPAVIGSLQALETLKYKFLTGMGAPFNGISWFLVREGATTDFQKFTIREGPRQPTCGKNQSLDSSFAKPCPSKRRFGFFLFQWVMPFRQASRVLAYSRS